MGEPPGTTDKRKAASSGTKSDFEKLWREIKLHSDDNWRINLTVAANITGFALYPVGWSWTECEVKDVSTKLPYREKAEALGRLTVASEGKSDRTGMRAFRRGCEFRRDTVSKVLLLLIARQQIPAFLTDQHGDTHNIEDRVRLFDDLNVDLRRSRLGFHDLRQSPVWYAETDATKLVSALDGKLAWRTNDTPNDWLVIERIAREIIEARGLPDVQADLFNSVLEKLTEHDPGSQEPARSTTLERLSRLRTEYGESEK